MKRWTTLLAALLTGIGLVPLSPVAAAAPAQQPGVTLRVFDLQTPQNAICVLKSGQTRIHG
jgi:hypothetical protein